MCERLVWYTHINRGVIDSNRKHGRNDPPIRFQKGKYGRSTYCMEARFTNGKVVYDERGTLLPCGARLVIVTEEKPEVIR